MNTKKLFSLFFILSLTISLPSWGQEAYCNNSGSSLDQMLSLIINSAPKECLESKFLQNRCKCLTESVKKNIFTKYHLDRGESEYEKKILEKKIPYTAQYDRVYEIVTTQAAAQEEVMGLTNDKKPIGCGPQLISGFVEDFSLETIPSQISDLEKLKTKANENLLKKKSFINLKANYLGPDFYSKRVAVIENKINALEALSCRFAKNLFSQEDSRAKVIEVIKHKKESGAAISQSEMQLGQLWDHYISGSLKPDDIIQKGLKGKCSVVVSAYKELLKEHKKLHAGGEGIPTPRNQDCDKNDFVCEKFKNKNTTLQENTKQQLTPNDDDCITYNEYATYKGMPGPELLKQFATMKDPEKALDEKNLRKNNSQALKFLQANPMIAVIAKGGQYKQELGKMLKEMAKNVLKNNAGGEAAAFKGYLDFMKGDFKDLYREKVDNSQMAVCSELARNFTAIELSNELPELENSSDDADTDDMEKIKELSKSCIGDVYEGTATTDLSETLKLSPIYSLGDDSIKGEPSLEGFKTFKDKYCGKYAEHKNNNCSDGDFKKCRESFQKTSEFATYSQEFEEHGLNETIDQDGWQRIADRTDDSKQDHAFQDEWMEKVWPNISKQAIMGSDDHGEYAAGIANNSRIFSSPNAPSRYPGLPGPVTNNPVAATDASSQENSNEASSLSEAQSKPGQQVPDYAKEVPTFDASKLAGASGPKDLIPNFEKLPFEEQKQSLTDVKKFIASQENPPFEAKEVDKELDKVNEEMTKEIAELEEKIEKVREGNKTSVAQSTGQKTSGPSFSTNTNSSNSSGGNQQSASSTISSGGSSNATAKINGGNKTANAINDHLIKTNEERSGIVATDAEGRSPASIKGEASINFQKGVFDPNLLQSGLVVSEVVPETHEEYEKIKGNLDQLKKYLAEQIDPKQIKGPMVYKIKDPLESPDSYILFHVSQASNGAINVKTIDRKSTLKSLNNTLK